MEYLLTSEEYTELTSVRLIDKNNIIGFKKHNVWENDKIKTALLIDIRVNRTSVSLILDQETLEELLLHLKTNIEP